MSGRTIFRIVIGIVAVVALVGLGAGLYNAGIDQGVVQAGRVPAGAAVPYAGYDYGWGFGPHPFFGFSFGLLGLIFPILFFLLIFGLIRAAFGGWGRGRGYGGHDGHGGYGPGSWQEERQRRFSELHRQLHEEEARASTAGPGSAAASSNLGGPTPPPGA